MINKIVIIGGNVFNGDGPVLNFIDVCIENKVEVFLITDETHLKYPIKNNNSFKSELIKRKIKFKSFKKFDHNTLKFITKLKNKNSTLISLNSIWIFSQKTIRKLKKIYNYHNIDLPMFRGAGCHSWRIMMDEMRTTINIHLLDKKIDQGDIVLKKKIKIPKYILNLNDFYKYLVPFETGLFEEFIKKLIKKKLKKTKQNNSKSFYWPALKTPINGFVDWNWSSKDIVLFSNSFDSPFIGISTFLNGQKINLTKAKIADKKKFHPFQIGIIYRRIKSRIFIVTSDGGVSFNFPNPKKIKYKLGDRVYIDPKTILASRGIK
jgi:methionyl-tRNA formyltransferase